MSSPFAYLRSATKKAMKAVGTASNTYDELAKSNPAFKELWPTKEDYTEHVWNMECKGVKTEIYWMQRMKDVIADDFNALIGTSTLTQSKQTFMITIRPDDAKTTFPDFVNKVNNLIAQKSFTSGSYSFEQKGTKIEDMGKGFHVHIIAQLTLRSKPDVIRRLLGTMSEGKYKNGFFSSWINDGIISANCIQVDVCKNPDEVIQNYLLDYKSEDGHKEETRSMDELWRTASGLERLYKFE